MMSCGGMTSRASDGSIVVLTQNFRDRSFLLESAGFRLIALWRRMGSRILQVRWVRSDWCATCLWSSKGMGNHCWIGW